MPKRDRDAEDKELDLEELKAMLRQSLDEKAELTSQLEEKTKQLAEERVRSRHQWLEQCLQSPGPSKAGVRYLNRQAIQQAEKAGVTDLLKEAVNNTLLGSNIRGFVSVDSTTELVDIFENGLSVGATLKESLGSVSSQKSLFRVSVVAAKTCPRKVTLDDRAKYIPLVARSQSHRFNKYLDAYLESKLPASMRPQPSRSMDTKLQFRSEDDDEYSDDDYASEVQEKILGASPKYNSTVLGVMVPFESDNDERDDLYIKVDLNFDRMVEVQRDGTERKIGFSVGKRENVVKQG